jgi:hypothetical protein
MRRTIRLILALAPLWLAACATAPDVEPYAAAACPADPRAAGFADATAGRPVAPGLSHLEACLADAAPEAREAALAAYARGHAHGVQVWCRPENAYELGREGLPRVHACPPEMAEAFETAYRRGVDDRGRGWPFALRPSLSVGVGSSGTHVGGGVGILF